MDASNGLHESAIAMIEPNTVDVLHAADIGCAVFCDRYAGIATDYAGHAGGPEQLITDVAINERVQIAQEIEQLSRLRQRRSNELEQRLGIIGCQVRVR